MVSYEDIGYYLLEHGFKAKGGISINVSKGGKVGTHSIYHKPVTDRFSVWVAPEAEGYCLCFLMHHPGQVHQTSEDRIPYALLEARIEKLKARALTNPAYMDTNGQWQQDKLENKSDQK